ncbi:hypothetical protein yc1106_08434 [Curvularia clavata]|uniref:RRM domain-containing protein n=1 Tax=Curvularia clavata TaxID=95742 RepID=A0A9Q9DWN9_CURCL|nr:hypothetical protein yc1106_08434 [Curvularia clavata]
MFKRLFGEHGAKNVVTLFHAPSNQASTRVLTLLKQANAQSVASATQDQASSHQAQNKAERTEFELDVTEAPPTTDQLKNILDYLGGPSAAGKVISGAESENDAMRRLKADAATFQRPLVVDWNQGKAVVGDNESEIMKLVRAIPKETGSAPTTSSTSGELATASAGQPHNAIATDMGKTTVESVQHATRDPRFGPGLRQGFFSTELGTQARRRLQLHLVPAVARSPYDAEAVVLAARYWQFKYKSEYTALIETPGSVADYLQGQCLCIFPNQGWTVDDLWDATDIHIDGRTFCEQMLTFIARDTWHAADRLAKDWARAYFQQVDFTGIHIGNVYDLNDPLSALDHIFVFGELNSFPRPFLWHVAFILITDWSNARLKNAPAFNTYQDQYLPVVAQRGNDEVKGSSVKITTSTGKKAALSSEHTARTDNIAVSGPDQSKLSSPPQRIAPHSSHPANDLQAHTRCTGLERMGTPSTTSPNIGAQGLKVHKGSRNLGSPAHSQPQGWIENESRTVPGPYPFPVPGMHQSQYGPPPIAVGPQMNASMIPSSAMGSYFVGPPVLTHPACPAQPMESGMMPRGHINYQMGAFRSSHMSPAHVNQQKEPQSLSMGDATNMYFSGFMRSQVVDPLAPMPRRLSQQNAGQLFDPYNGTSRKFSGGQVHNDLAKKGGASNFTAPQNRGRRSSTSSSARLVQGSHYYIPSTGSRIIESSNRRRLSEDDTSITGDSVYGCGHTWIGPKNTTVKELWIGDLPPDVRENELKQLFDKTVGITPLSISVKSNTVKGHVHAFANFASSADARAALTINQFDPRLRNGEVRPAISVPKRYYQKESFPAASSEYSRVVHPANGYAHGVVNVPLDGKSTATSAETETAAASDTVMYSPQDARSDLQKKPPTLQLEANNLKEATKPKEATDLTETKISELEKPKREDESPIKKTKCKAKKDSHTKKDPHVDTPNPNEKLEVDVLPTATIKNSKSSNEDDTNVQDVHSKLVHVESTSNAVQDMCHAANEKRQTIAEPLDQLAQLESPQSKDNVARSESSPTEMKMTVGSEPFQTPQHDETTASSVEAGKGAEDDASDDGAKNDTSFHSAPEVQPEATQMESEPETLDQSTDANHGIVIRTSEITHNSPLQDNLEPPATSEGPNIGTPRESNSDREKPTSASSNTEGNPEASGPRESYGQDKRIAADTAHIETSSVNQGAKMSAPVKGASTDAVKKCGVQQVQSLHPFATKSKAQAKKEKETKRKQQKKEEADRIAKAKADKADKVASSKKGKSCADPKPKTEMPTISATSSVVTDVHADSQATTSNTEKPEFEETKKSKGKSKAKAAKAQEEDKRISGSEKKRIDKSPAEAFTMITEKADKVETTNIPAVLKDSSAQTESFLSSPSSLAVPTPSPSQTGDTQPSTMVPCQSISRHSSISTIAGDMGGPNNTPSALPDNPETSDPSQDTCIGTTITQPENTLAETPKKTKSKKRTKKKKTPATEPSTTMEPDTNGEIPAHFPMDTHNYDPFTSQMTHIEAIQYHIEHDTTSYYATTNAIMEQQRLEREAKERKEQEREVTDASPQSGNDEQGGSSS